MAGQQREGQHGHGHQHDGRHRDRRGAAAEPPPEPPGPGRRDRPGQAPVVEQEGVVRPASASASWRAGALGAAPGAPGRADAPRWAAGRRPTGLPGRGRHPRRRRGRRIPARRAGPARARASRRRLVRGQGSLAFLGRRAPAWRAGRGRAAAALAGALGVRAPACWYGGCGAALLPLDAGLGPELVGPLPRGKARVLRARSRDARLARTDGLEARAARTAIPRLGRAEGTGRRLRRQR